MVRAGLDATRRYPFLVGMKGSRADLMIAALGASMLVGSAASQASAAISDTVECQFVSALPAIILEPGRYCLDRDLLWEESGAAISIASSDVQLDLMGYRVVTTRTGDPTVRGVYGLGDRIEVGGGVIDGFFWSVVIYGQQTVLQDLEVVRSGYAGLIAQGDGAQIRRNRVIDTGRSSGYPEACPECTIPIGIAGGGRDLVIADNVVAGITPVLEAIGISTSDSPGGRVVGNVIANEAPLPATWATWFAATAATDLQVSDNWISGFENGLTFSNTGGSYEGNTFFNLLNKVVCGCPDPLSVLDQGGNRVATGLTPMPVIRAIPTAATDGVGQAEVELRLSAAAPWTVAVDWRTLDAGAIAGIDYLAAEGQITFFPGERGRIVRIPLLPNPARTEEAAFRVELSNPAGAVTDGVGTVTLFAAACGTAPSTSLSFVAEGGSDDLQTDEACPTSAIATEPWISLATAEGGVRVTAAPSTLDATRSGFVHLPSAAIAVTQTGLGAPLPPALLGSPGVVRRIEPRLEWNASERALDYVVEIRDSTGQLIWHGATEAASSCLEAEVGPGACGIIASLSTPVPHDLQPVAWRVRGRNAAGRGEWSEPMLVSFAEPDPLTPALTIVNPSPAFRWTALDDGVEYRIWLEDATGRVLVDAWFGSEFCDAGVCEIASPVVLASGAYSWWVQARAGTALSLFSARGQFELTTPTVMVSDVTVTEGNAGPVNAAFTVTLTPAAEDAVTVAYETADATAVSASDYAVAGGTLTFAAGETSRTVTVTVSGDTIPEANETFFVNLASPSGNAVIGDFQGIGTITDDDALIECPASAPPGGVIPIEVLGGSSATDWLGWYPEGAANSAYTLWAYVLLPRPQTVNMAAPAAPGLYNLRLFAENSLTDVLGSCDIVVTPVPMLRVNDVAVTEGNGGTTHATFTVSLVPAAEGLVTVEYATAAETASSPRDYAFTQGTVTFMAGETSKTVTVAVYGDTRPETDETLFLTLSSPTGAAVIGDALGRGTIVTDDALMSCPASVLPGAPIPVHVFGGITPTYWLGFYPDGAGKTAYSAWAYVPLPRPTIVNLVAPATPGNYDIRFWANNEAALELGACDLVVASLPALSVNDVTVTEGNAGPVNATFTVVLTPAAGGPVTVGYATADGTALSGSDYAGTTGTLTFVPGQTSQTVTVVVDGDTTPEATEAFFLNLSSPTGEAVLGDAQGEGTITNDEPLLTCPIVAEPGGTLAVGAFGGSTMTDWLGLYPKGAADIEYTAWEYVPLPRPTTVNLIAPTTPGNYEIRFWANNTAILQLGACNIVVPPAPTLDAKVGRRRTGAK